MIQSKSPAVLYINKLSVLLVSTLLIFLWMKFESSESTQMKHSEATNFSNLKDSKYLKKTTINPFLRTENETPSKDILPTVTSLQTTVPLFTSIKLRLHGIVFQRDQNSYSMISMQGAIQEIFRVNDQISEGLYVTKISKKQVEVDYFGERHNLFIENTQIFNAITKPINETKERKLKLNFDQQIELLEVDKRRNPIRLFMIRRPYAVYSNGEFQGYKVMPGSNEDQFKRLGFKSGDIITYLNGIEFTGPGMKEFVITQLTHATHIDLTVIRDNQELTINYGF